MDRPEGTSFHIVFSVGTRFILSACFAVGGFIYFLFELYAAYIDDQQKIMAEVSSLKNKISILENNIDGVSQISALKNSNKISDDINALKTRSDQIDERINRYPSRDQIMTEVKTLIEGYKGGDGFVFIEDMQKKINYEPTAQDELELESYCHGRLERRYTKKGDMKKVDVFKSQAFLAIEISVPWKNVSQTSFFQKRESGVARYSCTENFITGQRTMHIVDWYTANGYKID